MIPTLGQAAMPVALYDAIGRPFAFEDLRVRDYVSDTMSARGVFGWQRAANPQVVFASSMQYDAAPLIWGTTATGAGNTAAHNADARSVALTLGGTAAGSVVRQTFQYIPYQEGRAQVIFMTGVIGDAVAGVVKRIGYFDAANGLFFEQDGSTKAVVRRSSVSGAPAEARVTQANWNIDPLTGSGPSGLVLDWTKDQIFVIEFGWLGTARVRFGFYLNGEIVYCHVMDHANALATSYMQSGTLPLRYEIGSAAIASATLSQICQAVASEGGYFDQPGYQFAAGRAVGSLISTASEAPLVALRPAATLNSIVNRVFIKIADVQCIGASSAFAWRLLYYPPGSADPITGGSWAAANANSATEFNVGGTALSLTGAIPLSGGYVPAAIGAARSVIGASIAQFYPLTLDAAGTNPAYLVVSGLGAGATGGAFVQVTEIR